jgi:hypothetical protein
MSDATGLYLLAAAIMVVAVFVYWIQPTRRAAVMAQSRNLIGLLVLISAGISLVLWSVTLERSEYTFERQSTPVAIAIAFDLSPSMLAIPDPGLGIAQPPRFERGKAVLLDYLRALEEQGQPVIVSVLGFTKNASIIMGWDQSTAQVNDILDYAVSPDLFGSSGTSMEAAAKSLLAVFSMLPGELSSTSRQLAIIVSDGEDTMRASSFDYAKQELSNGGFDTIALQTGLIDQNEGVPTYGQVGEFTGFRNMNGKLYTVPDFAAMNAIAEASSGRGLHVRAEATASVEQMRQFTLDGSARVSAPDAKWLSTLGMYAVVSLLCAMILR